MYQLPKRDKKMVAYVLIFKRVSRRIKEEGIYLREKRDKQFWLIFSTGNKMETNLANFLKISQFSYYPLRVYRR